MTRSARLLRARDVRKLLAGAVVVVFTAVLVGTGSAAVVAADESPVPDEDQVPSGAAIPTTERSAASSQLSEPSSPGPVPGDDQRVLGTVGLPELEISAEFDKPTYRPDDIVTVRFHLKNVGPEAYFWSARRHR